MSDFYEKIQRVLELELEKGFSNSAVSGGLQNFIQFVSVQGKSNNIPETVINTLSDFFQNYPDYSFTERKKITPLIISWLQNTPEKNTSPTLSFKPDKQQSSPNLNNKEKTFQDPALYAGLQSIIGIGKRNSKYFEKLGITSIYDLLRYYPRKYQDYSHLKTINQIAYGDEVTLAGVVMGDLATRPTKRGNLKITEAILTDSTGTLKLTWFNQPFLKNQIKAGASIVVSGKVDMFRGRFTMSSPVWELLEKEQIHTNRIVPIYPATAGISQRQIRNIIKRNIDFWSNKVIEYLPEKIIAEQGFDNITHAIQQVHFPDALNVLDAVKKRFAFEEIFFLQLGYLFQKSVKRDPKTRSFPYDQDLMVRRKENLPYQLTAAQERAVEVLISDLSKTAPMNRLLQGDVGSGKTVVAKFAIESILDTGSQAAVLAPTSILAEQHHKTLTDLLTSSGCLQNDEIGLLLGSTPPTDKKGILERLENGKIRCIIGTHAILEENVIFNDLQLIVIDEQQRFGVNQRNTLRLKGDNPHTLVMSATPIPRSLALTLYGDLDITTIDEMPPGRMPVQTRIVPSGQKGEAYQLIREQIDRGFQAFVVYPMIEGDEEDAQRSVIAEHERLRSEIFPGYKVGILHGKMKPSEKESVMLDFRNHQYDILVSTTVIEVGVDIPDATVVIIESANYFGLAQLHQIRGRVGRNSESSYCILIPDTNDAAENERLKAMENTNDGFELADIDLRLRGPGEFLGTRQSGYIGFKFADITNTKLIETSRNYVHNIIDNDPSLGQPQNQLIREELESRWPGVKFL